MDSQNNGTDEQATLRGQEQIEAILRRSATDPEFRQALLEDPKGTLAAEGHEVPGDFNVVFVENQGDATFVLPDVVDTDSELSEEELESVAGGGTSAIFASIMGTIAVAETIKRIGDDDAWLS